jgi:hypothetical protein
MVDLIFKCPELLSQAQIELKGEERIKKEASKNRQTFKNGCEYQVFSAHGEANRLMGFGADLIIVDEACLVGRDAYTKITRMLGDNPDESILIELYNPWDRDNKAFEHTLYPEFKVMHIDYSIAIKEGRTTEAFIEEQRKELTPLEFTVLYESQFPEMSEDAIFNLKEINAAEERDFKLKDKKGTEMIIGCDVADKGIDETVILIGYTKDNQYEVTEKYSEAISDNMRVAGKIIQIIKDKVGKKKKCIVNIDAIGVGVGVISRVKEFCRENGYKNVKINDCHFGKASIRDKKKYLNQKAEQYFRVQHLLNEKLLSIIPERKLKTQLVNMKWELTSAGKIRVKDPENKSPDWADALVFFCWKGKEVIIDF